MVTYHPAAQLNVEANQSEWRLYFCEGEEENDGAISRRKYGWSLILYSQVNDNDPEDRKHGSLLDITKHEEHEKVLVECDRLAKSHKARRARHAS